MPPRHALIPASYVYLRRTRTDGAVEVLLQRRANTGYRDGHWVAGAAGHVDLGESARETAVREAAEELGVRIDPQDLQLLTVMQRTDGSDDPIEQRVDWFWACDRFTGEPAVQEPSTCSGLGWFALDALPEPMPDYERHVIAALGGAAIEVASSWVHERG